jgi:arylsulfatase A-like enzyme/Tfp pilus assembly protein PilF
MFKNKKILIPVLILLVLIAFLIYWFFLKAPAEKKFQAEGLTKTFQSLIAPVSIEEMNIVLFTIDTLRADHLECYGYKGVKTPNINRLADEGVLFKYDIVQTPLTLPSHSSILTGTYPLFHGIRDNGGFYLDENQITLAEELRDKDYSTSAFVAAFVLDSRWGVDQGFDYYFDNFDLTKYKKVSLDSVQRRGDEVLAEAYKWLKKNSHAKFFSWIHLYDPHTPYEPPEPYLTQYKGFNYGLYDGEIAYVDQLMGEFLSFMEENGLLEKTLIIFTSDHGESLGEHKESAHGFFIYDAAVRVPLIIRFPNKKLSPRIIENRVKSIDIMPTILNLVGEKIPENVQGESLLPLILRPENIDEPGAYSETYWPNYHYGWSELKSLSKGRYKFIDAPRPELYDLFEDPGEKNNLVNKKASLGHQMKRELDELIEKYSAEGIEDAGPQTLDNDSLVKLQALGYIGSFRSSSKKRGEKLADPKDKIELYNEIKLAQFLVTKEEMEKAENKIKDVLNKDPSVLEARYILGNIYDKQKEYDKAIEEYKKALAVEPEYSEAIFGLASVFKKKGKIEEAIIGFKRLIEIDPKDTKPLLHLADIYLGREELDEALRYLKSGTEIDPEAPIFHNQLGAVFIQKEMYDEAEKEIKIALSIERSIPLNNAHFNLALIREARGDYAQAILEYEKEQEVSPYNHKPDFNLGLLFSKRKDFDRALKEFTSCIEKKEDYGEAYIFLAKTYMDSQRDLNEAAELALKGLTLEPEKKSIVLGHFLLADIYNRLGNSSQYQHHLDQARRLQKTLSN